MRCKRLSLEDSLPSRLGSSCPIIKGLKRREPTIDFATANAAGLAGLDDRAVIALAAANGRILVSHDVSTMPNAFSRFIRDQASPGVILISQELSYREAIEGLLRVWLHTEAEDWENIMSFLPR